MAAVDSERNLECLSALNCHSSEHTDVIQCYLFTEESFADDYHTRGIFGEH